MVCRLRLVFVGTLAVVGVACGSTEPESGDGGSFAPSAPVGACGAVTQQHAIEGANHVATCSYIDYRTLPPSSGDHYQFWAAYMTYDKPVPEGYWVHDLEHGGVVLSYNCGAAGCAADIAAAQRMIDAYPADPVCAADGIRNRLLMTPDPRLDVRFAASAWGWTLRAKCFELDAFLAFVKAHYGQGTEVICGGGEDVIGTTSGDPPGCGVDQ